MIRMMGNYDKNDGKFMIRMMGNYDKNDGKL